MSARWKSVAALVLGAVSVGPTGLAGQQPLTVPSPPVIKYGKWIAL